MADTTITRCPDCGGVRRDGDCMDCAEHDVVSQAEIDRTIEKTKALKKEALEVELSKLEEREIRKKLGLSAPAGDRPTSVSVLGVVYSIEWPDHVNNDNGDPMYGTTTPVESKIEISASAQLPVQKKTLLHEIMHVCYVEGGMRGINARDLSERADIEEMFCSLMEQPLLSAIRDNPEVMRWLSS